MTTDDEETIRTLSAAMLDAQKLIQPLVPEIGESPEAWRGVVLITGAFRALITTVLEQCQEATDEHEEAATMVLGWTAASGFITGLAHEPAFQLAVAKLVEEEGYSTVGLTGKPRG